MHGGYRTQRRVRPAHTTIGRVNDLILITFARMSDFDIIKHFPFICRICEVLLIQGNRKVSAIHFHALVTRDMTYYVNNCCIVMGLVCSLDLCCWSLHPGAAPNVLHMLTLLRVFGLFNSCVCLFGLFNSCVCLFGLFTSCVCLFGECRRYRVKIRNRLHTAADCRRVQATDRWDAPNAIVHDCDRLLHIRLPFLPWHLHRHALRIALVPL
eukprot:SAG11_NODE_994_length_6261_cov_10.558747_4_plen_211_part_00